MLEGGLWIFSLRACIGYVSPKAFNLVMKILIHEREGRNSNNIEMRVESK